MVVRSELKTLEQVSRRLQAANSQNKSVSVRGEMRR